MQTFESHDISQVLRLDWLGEGQLVTNSRADLVKVWWVDRQECTATLDMGMSDA